MTVSRIQEFFKTGIWQSTDDRPWWVRLGVGFLQRAYLSVKFFFERGHSDYAAQLSFTTMLAIVPLFSFIFAIGKGFGLSEHLEQWCREAFVSQPQVADLLIELSNSYLLHTQTGLFIGIGLLFMLYTILSLIRNVERIFDAIWQVDTPRSWTQSIMNYTALLFLVPIMIIVISGLSIFIYAIVDPLRDTFLLGELTTFSLQVVFPWVVLSLIFTALNMVIPHTKVRFASAVFPSMLAAALMLLLQWGYVHGQSYLTSYNAIYGSLAALPLFMLWLQLSWYICLFCVELCYTHQNVAFYEYLLKTKDMSHQQRLTMSALLVAHICERFARGAMPPTALELHEETGLPLRITTDLLHRLVAVKLLWAHQAEGEDAPTFLPAQDTDTLTLGLLVHRLECFPDAEAAPFVFPSSCVVPDTIYTALRRIHGAYLSALYEYPIRSLFTREEAEEKTEK